jgi:hypothetical protein
MTFERFNVDIHVLPPLLVLVAAAVFLFGLMKLFRR